MNNSNPVAVAKQLISTYANKTDDDFDLDTYTVAYNARTNYKCFLVCDGDNNSLNRVVDDLTKQHNVVVFENLKGKICFHSLIIPTTMVGLPTITRADIIIKSSMAEYSEEYTELDYLITDMDAQYMKLNSSFLRTIDSADLSQSVPYTTMAKSYLGDEPIDLNLQLETVFDQTTAELSAKIKNAYHSAPTRIINVSVTIEWFQTEIGDWLLLANTGIADTDSSVFLVVGHLKSIPPNEPFVKLKLLEFRLSSTEDNHIQEIPGINSESWQEVPTVASEDDKIQEVPLA